MDVWRRVIARLFAGNTSVKAVHITHNDIFSAAQSLDAAGQLSLARICFLSRICKSAPSAVCTPQDLSGGFPAWLKTAKPSTKWPDRCKTLLKYAKRNMLLARDLRRWHVELSGAFKMSAVPLPEWLCGPGIAPCDLVCFECGAISANRTALAVHSRILHGHLSQVS